MHNGLLRFEFYLNQLQELLSSANKQKNPALWLYRNNARTPLFMLEGLAKLYAAIHNKKRFTKIKEHFKLLEDAIGAIDYYDTIAKDLAGNKKISGEIKSYLQAETREKTQSLNEILLEKNWMPGNENRLVKIHTKLRKADWLDEADEIKAIETFYGKEIYEISEFIQSDNFHFDNMELDVHELRRKLRWLSIYPQALQGCIQAEKRKPVPSHLKKYATKEILASPFNKMPDPGYCKQVLLIDQHYLYALSWIIAELGNIKDSGLHLIAVKEALQLTEGLQDEPALKRASQLLGPKQPKLEPLLLEADKISNVFFKEQNLEHLVIGITTIA